MASTRAKGTTGAGTFTQPMTPRVRHLIALAAVLAALALPAAAVASPSAVVRDCAEDGSVDGNYSNEDKQAALKQIPADLDEYSDCRSVIAGSIKNKRPTARASNSADTDDGAVPAAARSKGRKGRPRAEKRVKREKGARKRKLTEDLIASRSAEPATAGIFDKSSTANGMPLPVLLTLIALTLLLLGGGLYALGRRNPGILAALRRVPLARRNR